MANQECSKHGKLFDPEQGQTCPGCETEKAGGSTDASGVKGPDDTLHELREDFQTRSMAAADKRHEEREDAKKKDATSETDAGTEASAEDEAKETLGEA